jgi:hypothetical protein
MDIATIYDAHVAAFEAHPTFARLEDGTLCRGEYDQVLLNIVRTHCKSPQLLAFLFSLAPPATSANLRDNMLEELGVVDDGGEAHPALLEQLVAGAGLGDRMDECRALAESDMRRVVTEPILYESLVQLGFAALIEITSFEYLLARVADRLADALASHRGLDAPTRRWFTHHGKVDIAHAESGLDNIERYRDYYRIDPIDAATIVELTTRENLFVKRYFADIATAASGAR